MCTDQRSCTSWLIIDVAVVSLVPGMLDFVNRLPHIFCTTVLQWIYSWELQRIGRTGYGSGTSTVCDGKYLKDTSKSSRNDMNGQFSIIFHAWQTLEISGGYPFNLTAPAGPRKATKAERPCRRRVGGVGKSGLGVVVYGVQDGFIINLWLLWLSILNQS